MKKHPILMVSLLIPFYTYANNIVFDSNSKFKVTHHTSENHNMCTIENNVDFGCDHFITPESHGGSIKIKPGQLDIKPGQMVCVATGTYKKAEVYKVVGNEEKPVVITNCGGQVEVDGQFSIIRSSHIKLLGDGNKETTYGFKINGKQKRNTSSSLNIRSFSRDIELAYLDVSSKLGRAAIHFNSSKPKLDENGNTSHIDPVTGKVFIQTNSNIHHNFIHDSLEGEGIYLGVAGCDENDFKNGAALENTYVHNNIVTNHGADGIQVGCARKNTYIYNNYIEKVGYAPFKPNAGHTKGIQLGMGTSGYVFNNYLKDVTSDCIFIGGGPTLDSERNIALSLYNNIGVNCDSAFGVHSSAKNIVKSQQLLSIANNTMINMKRSHFWINRHHSDKINVKAFNNLFVENGYGIPHISVNGRYNVGNNFDEQGTLIFDNPDDVRFKDWSKNDFRLTSESPAIDSGVHSNDIDVVNDIRNIERGHFDVGAFEYNSSIDSLSPDNSVVNITPSQKIQVNIRSNGRVSFIKYEGGNKRDSRVDVVSRGIDKVLLTLEDVSEEINAEKLDLFITASSQTKMVNIENHIEKIDNKLFIEIPLDSFEFESGKLEGGIYNVGLKSKSGIGEISFSISSIKFIGDQPYDWFSPNGKISEVKSNNLDSISVSLVNY